MFSQLPISAILLISTITSGSPLPQYPPFTRRYVDIYRMYIGNGNPSDGWPEMSQWVQEFDILFNANKPNMLSSCAQFSVPNNSEDEVQAIHDGIVTVAEESGVDARFIMSIMMQESTGCVRAPTTIWSVRNPGLMQDHNGTANCNTGVAVQSPCPASTITQMIRDGVTGTVWGAGLQQLIEKTGCSTVQKFYMAARMYNSGSISAGGDLGASESTHCYASDIANRLTGWVYADHACCLNTGCSPGAVTYASTPSTGWWSQATPPTNFSSNAVPLTESTTYTPNPLWAVTSTTTTLDVPSSFATSNTSPYDVYWTATTLSTPSSLSSLLAMSTTSPSDVSWAVTTWTSISTTSISSPAPTSNVEVSYLIPTPISVPPYEPMAEALSSSGLAAASPDFTSVVTSISEIGVAMTMTSTLTEDTTTTMMFTWPGNPSPMVPRAYVDLDTSMQLSATTARPTPSTSTRRWPAFYNSTSSSPTAYSTSYGTSYGTSWSSSYGTALPTSSGTSIYGTASATGASSSPTPTQPWTWPTLTQTAAPGSEKHDAHWAKAPSTKPNWTKHGWFGSWRDVIGAWW
ncbi:hypothetical protein NA57DRAFT_72048 [Rhizodiscina lignyota]|uniref:Uncharacterized protein n=1 Tax=Rhizodiscina lignyota TaxID=1504668 RepID=A0A9P4M9Q3_9PEZI|nr:hypothetical protein NA57DRAFT_72048 [Rhizodiscina lignyota]